MSDTRTTAEKLKAEEEIELRVAAASAQAYAAGMARMDTLEHQRAAPVDRVRAILAATITMLEATRLPAASAAAVILRELVADI